MSPILAINGSYRSDGVTDLVVNHIVDSLRETSYEEECWYPRLSDPHSVENRGREDRVHMVIDAEVNPWLNAMLQGKAAPGKISNGPGV